MAEEARPQWAAAETERIPEAGRLKARLRRPVALVGLMGAGKTTVGRRLARLLGLPFLDVDREMEIAAGRSLADILESWGEAEYRNGERRIVRRLVGGGPSVIATGGKAFEDARTRRLLQQETITVWLKADVDVLHSRTKKRPEKRPFLDPDNARSMLATMADEKADIFKAADIAVASGGTSRREVAGRILKALEEYLNGTARQTRAD